MDNNQKSLEERLLPLSSLEQAIQQRRALPRDNPNSSLWVRSSHPSSLEQAIQRRRGLHQQREIAAISLVQARIAPTPLEVNTTALPLAINTDNLLPVPIDGAELVIKDAKSTSTKLVENNFVNLRKQIFLSLNISFSFVTFLEIIKFQYTQISLNYLELLIKFTFFFVFTLSFLKTIDFFKEKKLNIEQVNLNNIKEIKSNIQEVETSVENLSPASANLSNSDDLALTPWKEFSRLLTKKLLLLHSLSCHISNGTVFSVETQKYLDNISYGLRSTSLIAASISYSNFSKTLSLFDLVFIPALKKFHKEYYREFHKRVADFQPIEEAAIFFKTFAEQISINYTDQLNDLSIEGKNELTDYFASCVIDFIGTRQLNENTILKRVLNKISYTETDVTLSKLQECYIGIRRMSLYRIKKYRQENWFLLRHNDPLVNNGSSRERWYAEELVLYAPILNERLMCKIILEGEESAKQLNPQKYGLRKISAIEFNDVIKENIVEINVIPPIAQRQKPN